MRKASVNPVEPSIAGVTAELREALLEAVGHRVTPPFKPIELNKQFGIDRRLGWELSRMMQDADVFAAARHFPGRAALNRFLRAASAKDVAEQELERIRLATEEFEKIIAEHGGDRDRFDLVLASLSAAEARDELLAQRRAAFLANRFIYGGEASIHLRSRVLSPSTIRDGFIDIISVGGLVDLLRLKPDTPWPVYVRRWHDASGRSQGPTQPRAADPVSGDDPPMLRTFCEPESIDVDRVEVEPGLVEYVLPPGPLGETGAVSCLVGEVFDAVGPAFARPDDDAVEFNTRVGTPAERLVIDTFIHRDLAVLGNPTLLLRNEIQRVFRGRKVWTEADDLEPLAAPQVLGSGPAVVGMIEARWYGRMVAHVLESNGHDPDDFLLHRVVIPYPPLGATATVRYALPDRPEGDEP
ncbi:MAG: hypothetical protein AAF297_00780 [Planctomycetota bacterium]